MVAKKRSERHQLLWSVRQCYALESPLPSHKHETNSNLEIRGYRRPHPGFRRNEKKEKMTNEEHVHGPDCDHENGHSKVEKMAAEFTDQQFPKIWEHSKKQIKELSKKDIAQQMFFTGAAMILEGLQQQQHNEEESSEKVENTKEITQQETEQSKE